MGRELTDATRDAGWTWRNDRASNEPLAALSRLTPE